MHGDLREESVADVLRALAARSFTGRLSITAPGGGAAAWFVDGDLVRATAPAPVPRLGDRLRVGGLLSAADLARALAEQSEARSGDDADDHRLGALLVERELVREEAVRLVLHEQVLDAVHQMLRIERGAWDADEDGGEEAVPVVTRLPVDQALVELSRRETDWAPLTRLVPDVDLVPEFVRGAEAAPGLEPDEFALLARVDGELTIRQLATFSGHDEFTAARVVHALVQLGVLRLRDQLGTVVSGPHDVGSVTDAGSGGADPSGAGTASATVTHGTSHDAAPMVAASVDADGTGDGTGDGTCDDERDQGASPHETDPPVTPVDVDELEPWAPTAAGRGERPTPPLDEDRSALLRELSALADDEDSGDEDGPVRR